MATPARPVARALAVALLGALAATGCQTQALPVVEGRPTPAVSPSSAPAGLVLASASPTAAPATSSPDDEPVALATAGVDSEVAADDQLGIQSLIDSDDLKAFLPSTLIHDGGVILYRALGLRDAIKAARADGGATATPAASGAATCNGPAAAPEGWTRNTTEKGARQLKIRRVAGQPDQASVIVTWQNRGSLAFTLDGKKVRKAFVETNKRTILVERTAKRWRVIGVSPIEIEPLVGHAGLDLQQVRVYRGGSATPVLAFTDGSPVAALDAAVPVFTPGEMLRVEVEVQNKKACPPFVFAHLVGQANRTRQPLRDTGTQGDALAGDGIYSGTFTIPDVSGAENIAIDVLQPNTFTAQGPYRSNGLGMTMKVKAPN